MAKRCLLCWDEEAKESAAKQFDICQAVTTIGRESPCDLLLPGSAISQPHAVLLERNGQYQLQDAGSTNGIYLLNQDNEQKVISQRRVTTIALRSNDLLWLGGYYVRFLDESVSQRPRSQTTVPQPPPALDETSVVGLLTGKSQAIKELKERIDKVAPLQTSVLLTGETGTGKSTIAAHIHELSPRRSGPFVAVNCAAIPQDMLESYLFGHRKGSFTGAHEDLDGSFVSANGGTLLLDEVADLQSDHQAKLLRALDEGLIRRIGDPKEIPVDVRLIAASSIDLSQARGDGTFRDELYWRLAKIALTVPPLRERPDEIRTLATIFLNRYIHEAGRAADTTHFNPEVWPYLERREWPGNIRELEAVVTEAAIMRGGQEIRPEHLKLERSDGRDFALPLTTPLVEVRLAAEKRHFERALAQGWSKKRLAQELGITPSTLRTQMRKCGLE